MTKLEELKAAYDAAVDAYYADDEAYAETAYNAAYDAADDAWIAYREELEKQNDKT